LSPKWTKSRTRGSKPHLTKTKARISRARQTRADLERQLKACKREIANARERLIEATKQQAATSEMLRIISDSPLQSVLDAVAEHAARLCDSNNAEIYRLENNLLRLVASYGELPVHIQAREGFPLNRDRVIGRAICDRRSVHVHDLAAEDSEYPSGSSDAKRQGHRTTLGTPLLRERTPIGVILFRRWEVRPFSDKQIALLESFADQAAIAIESVRLFEAERQHTLALAQANRDLAEREAKIRRLVDANIIGIFIWDFDGRVLEANDEFLRMVNYDREDLVACRIRWANLTPPDWRDRNNARIDQQKSSGRFEPFEKEFTRKDGSRVPILIGGATFDEGGNQGVAFVLDLTERKCAEEALRESEAKFRDYAESASDWYWETDPDHKFTRLTEDDRRLALGLPTVSRIGVARWEFATDVQSEPEKWELHRSMLKARQPFRDFVYRATHSDGSVVYNRISGKPVFDANGEFRGYRGTGTDVTALRTAEREARENEQRYRKAELELAHANRVATMGQLTASITHEVNQPITAAITYALAARRFLSVKPPNLHEVDDVLSLIVKEGKRAGEVVERVRALIKKVPTRKDAVAIDDAILEVIALTRAEAANNSVSMRTQIAEGLPRVQGDRVQLQQVTLNLVVNAIQAMSGIGEGAREIQISIDAVPSEGGVRVGVRDTGPGLSPESLSRLFEPFYTTKPGGMGLGLSISHSIIEGHGGRLWAIPCEPQGALFQFTIPAD
jgi:PAS domain S-box-containing protein